MYQSISQIGPQTTEFFELREKEERRRTQLASTRPAGFAAGKKLLQKLVVHLLGHEVLLCVVRNQLTLYLAMYESFTTLQQTNVQVFVPTR